MAGAASSSPSCSTTSMSSDDESDSSDDSTSERAYACSLSIHLSEDQVDAGEEQEEEEEREEQEQEEQEREKCDHSVVARNSLRPKVFAVIGALRFDRAGSQRKRESVAERLNGASKIVQRQRELKKSGDGKVVNLTFREAAKAIIEAGRVARVERLQKRRERRDSMQNYRRGLLAAPQPPVTIRTASIFNPLDIVPEENEVRHGLSYRDGKKSVSEERSAETPGSEAACFCEA